MPPLTHPYPIRGFVTLNGTPQTSTNVTVRNDTHNEEYTTQTQSVGEYVVTITDTNRFPSGCYDGDTIKVTSLGVSVSTTVDDTNYPAGRRVDITIFTVTDSGSGADAIAATAAIPVTDSGVGTDAAGNPVATLSTADSGVGADSISALAASLSVADSGVGADNVSVTGLLVVPVFLHHYMLMSKIHRG